MKIQFNKNILLTGAGFTADFGGYLVAEMWAQIFNCPNLKDFPRIKEALRNQFNFEFVYWLVERNAKYNTDEKKAFRKAIITAYEKMDSDIISHLRNAQLGNLFNMFRGDSSTISAHFTLNQDLFLERRNHRVSLGLRIPEYKKYFEEIDCNALKINDITLPNDELLKKIQTQYLSSVGSEAYIKLHGSQGWLSENGSNAIVIGYDKTMSIGQEPLLKWYFELFKTAINTGDAKILIIGYSFRDKHVNTELAKAAQSAGLKIYILSPSTPESIKLQVSGLHLDDDGKSINCGYIWDAVDGYFPYKVGNIFPKDGTRSSAQSDLLKMFSG